MLLLAGLHTVVYHYAQKDDVIVGSPVAARPYTELYDQVGFYLNTLALRTQFEPSDSFRALLGKVKETVKVV